MPKRPAARAAARGGFTVIEVMAALTILAVGVLGLALMQLHAMHGERLGRNTTAAALVARDQMERFMRMKWADLPPVGGGWVAQAPVSTTVQSAPANFVEQTFTVAAQVRDLTVGWTRQVDVRVTWNEPERPNKTLVLSSIKYKQE
ncbi:MAG TPA: prepilin-type N-terminal cleavage/methylation domain-containing protein [Myxococcota bacterium]|nr:prepilin-type N-terminal cleavage/methylation domain-containing protein [Myxococcota bacterium]